MSMQVIEKNIGPKIAYEEIGTRVTFGDEELMLNLARYQRDWPVHLDVCSNRDGQLVVGTGTGLYYVAQLDIPAIQYAEPEPVETRGSRRGAGAAGTAAARHGRGDPDALGDQRPAACGRIGGRHNGEL